MKRLTISGAVLLLAASPALLAEEHDVILQGSEFDPQHLTIEVGDSVRWTNQDPLPHNVTADDGSFRCAEGCDSGAGGRLSSYHNPEPDPGTASGDPSSSNWSFSLTFDEPGEIGYYCEVHGSPGVGMFGTITVEEGEDEESGMPVNFGMTGSWFNPATDGQGLLLDVVVGADEPFVQIFWFTFDLEAGGPSAQRWMTADGPFDEDDDTVTLQVYLPTGGAFDQSEPEHSLETIGMAELHFEDCTNATLEYELDFDGDSDMPVSGTIPLVRLSPDVMCEELAEDNGE